MCAYAERHGAVQTMISLACYLNVVTLSTSPSPTIIFPKHSLPWSEILCQDSCLTGPRQDISCAAGRTRSCAPRLQADMQVSVWP